MLSRFRPYGPLLLILFAASCFEYRGGPGDHLSAGRDVRITLTPEARSTLASRVGAQVRSINGIVRGADTSDVLIAMSRTTLTDGTEAQWSGDTVTIPTRDIALLEPRQMATSKTVVLIALVAGVAAAVALSIGLSTSSSSGSGPSGGAK